MLLHLFVPGSQLELQDLMAFADTTREYIIGLQDRARRGGGGNVGTWTDATNYNPDADGIWKWTDRSFYGIDATNPSKFIFSTIDSSYTHVDYPIYKWSKIPVMGEIYAFLEYSGSSWKITTSSSLSQTYYYICEASKVCITCPSAGWYKFDGFSIHRIQHFLTLR